LNHQNPTFQKRSISGARIVSLAGLAGLPEDAEKSAAEVLNATWMGNGS
jgi:hypothetical protein